MYRTLVILRHTFVETVVQPIYSLLLAIGGAILILFASLPFFTLGDDTVMFKAVGLDVILLLVLVATLFATSKSIFEEIEDRTMLTLMSKPVHKWEVLVGKYLGIILAALMAVAILGLIFMIGTWMRIPGDYQLRVRSLDPESIRKLHDTRVMHLTGLLAGLVLVWLQVSVLAAIGVALSTRFSLVVNLPAVILIYIAGNLARFLPAVRNPGTGESNPLVAVLWVVSQVFPFLQIFDFREHTVYGDIRVPGTEFELVQTGAISMSLLAGYVGLAALYAVAFSAFALSAGMLSFARRELGGAEG
jgi:ABC-type transport system involved in multi-copper enzyme maturation permease subunit